MNEFHQVLNATLTHLSIMIPMSTIPLLIIDFACSLDLMILYLYSNEGVHFNGIYGHYVLQLFLTYEV